MSEVSLALNAAAAGPERNLVNAALLGARSVILVKADNCWTTCGYSPRYVVRLERLGLLERVALKFVVGCAAASEAKAANERSLECILSCLVARLLELKGRA